MDAVFSPDARPPLTPQLFAPGAVWLNGEESLRVTTWNMTAAVTIAVYGRYLTPDGLVKQFAFYHTPNTDRTAKSDQLSSIVGWLLNVSAIATAATPLIGGCYALLKIVRGDSGAILDLVTLAGGHLTSQQPVSYPASPLRSSLEGPGIIRSITGTDQAAGAEISETVPTGARWRLISISATLVTSATVANRDVCVTLDDGTKVFFRSNGQTNHPASNTFVYTFANIGQIMAGAVTNSPQCVLPADVKLIAGCRIKTVTTNLDAGDNWGAPQLLVEEWQEAA